MGSTSAAVVWTDPGCIELVIADGSSSASTTGAETTWTVACVPGGAWSGRSAVHLAASKCTRSLQSVGQQLTGGQADTVRGSEKKTNCTSEVDSQVILFDGRRADSQGGRTEPLVDSSTRRIQAWRVATKASGAS